MSKYAKGLSNVGTFVKRWKDRLAKRTNRIYDDRDQVLADAIKLVEERSPSYYPAITHIDEDLAALSIAGGAMTGITVTGTNLVGDMEKASGSTSDSTGELSFEAVMPGDQTITVTIDLAGGASVAITADADAGTILLSHDGTVTASAMVSAIAADAEAKFMVIATEETAGAMDAAEAVTVECTGADPGTLPTITLGDQTFTGEDAGFGFTAWTDTALTMDLDPSGLDQDTTYLLHVWVDDVLILSIPCSVVA